MSISDEQVREEQLEALDTALQLFGISPALLGGDLRAAAELYEQCRVAMVKAGQPRLADQFQRQADQAMMRALFFEAL